MQETTSKLHDKLADYIEDAYALEVGVVDDLDSMIGTSARPFSVSAYSTRGGTSGNVSRATMPSSSSALSRSESVRADGSDTNATRPESCVSPTFVRTRSSSVYPVRVTYCGTMV